MHRLLLHSPAARIALIAIALSLLFLGQRAIWDPDEGRYTNVALHMLDSGNWIEPQRSHEVDHWTKPPLTYWAIASSVAVFGHNPWAARLPAALSYLLCVLLSGLIARRLAPGSQQQAALAYATMLLPIGAAQLITTDYVLATCETLALWGFVEARFGASAQARRTTALGWLAVMWLGFGLAFLTKGPPGLLPLLAVLGFDLATPGRVRPRALQWSGLLLFLLVAAPWYLLVVQRHPGLLQYFLGSEVVDRVASDDFSRHGQWYGWIAIYLPTLLVGTLPWTPALLRWARGLPASVGAWRAREARTADAAQRLLALWLLLPLLVFCVSRSRMPLYILPLFVPLAVLVARQRLREHRPLPRWRWLLIWVALALALQLAAARFPTHKDAAGWAQAIRARVDGPVSQVNFVEDMARYGLHLHLGTDVEKLSMQPLRGAPRFNPEYDAAVTDLLDGDFDPDSLWIIKQARVSQLRALLAAHGFAAIAQGAPYEGRVLLRVRRVAIAGH
jgi:4-amino-4-deoxy-L-arabinose transferase-like glycosyltransferase